jgi:hypothetical protein
MQKVHVATSDKPVVLYNLDAVISVRYRVNSARGTQFRIWANGALRDHLLRGYTLNERRLRERGLSEMEQAARSSSPRSPSARRQRHIHAGRRGLSTRQEVVPVLVADGA